MKIAYYKVNTKKKSKLFMLFGIGISVIAIIWAAIFFFPVSERPEKSFFQLEDDRPMVIAHQGGEHLAPSNTLVAFDQAVNLGVDAIEFDIHMTKDGHLVAIHDPTVDRTTDGKGKVNDMTLEEVIALDAGYYFNDLNGEYSFRGLGIRIPTIDEIFTHFSNTRMVIEIKDSNRPELYESIVDELWTKINQYDVQDNVLVASFNQDIIEMFIDKAGDEVAISGGRSEIKRFVIFHKLLLNSLYSPKVDAIQIPIQEGNFNLKDKKLIRGAHARGMDVHYWTINDRTTMEKIIELGADGIITDRPDIALDLLGE
ncbi:glycerophosphoryl diester phosphodiesterase [Evansella cellulosilytica DSM 2522]|uniref:Glycerophosphoryl diester phosphodiesterase n=1 Tax=Evansella cellulosilytica (strain ATCC 21833 / DSM 2522 / FERM P-1141 / JCM 9156 / N-4) TaxID=649639 RepID=E6U1T1_EVAC2|nr:glycerophosphoryl diester phosphodiesterase [Evansella cellulosilytica DSM 2522]